jgi:hypothetical protein
MTAYDRSFPSSERGFDSRRPLFLKPQVNDLGPVYWLPQRVRWTPRPGTEPVTPLRRPRAPPGPAKRPRCDLFLGASLRGLPARTPAEHSRARHF